MDWRARGEGNNRIRNERLTVPTSRFSTTTLTTRRVTCVVLCCAMSFIRTPRRGSRRSTVLIDWNMVNTITARDHPTNHNLVCTLLCLFVPRQRLRLSSASSSSLPCSLDKQPTRLVIVVLARKKELPIALHHSSQAPPVGPRSAASYRDELLPAPTLTPRTPPLRTNPRNPQLPRHPGSFRSH